MDDDDTIEQIAARVKKSLFLLINKVQLAKCEELKKAYALGTCALFSSLWELGTWLRWNGKKWESKDLEAAVDEAYELFKQMPDVREFFENYRNQMK